MGLLHVKYKYFIHMEDDRVRLKKKIIHTYDHNLKNHSRQVLIFEQTSKAVVLTRQIKSNFVPLYTRCEDCVSLTELTVTCEIHVIRLLHQYQCSCSRQTGFETKCLGISLFISAIHDVRIKKTDFTRQVITRRLSKINKRNSLCERVLVDSPQIALVLLLKNSPKTYGSHCICYA